MQKARQAGPGDPPMSAERTPTALDYETVIGLEVHVQLSTASKMFCSCAADYQAAEPNTRVCPTCLGMPGTLPVVNQKAVEHTIMTGLALNCRIAGKTKFDRKNYAYPDLMKGYQISQYDVPIAFGGCLQISTPEGAREIRITRIHMEEDVAKLLHVRDDANGAYTLMDINRAGVPLMEIVSEPDMRSADEAREYLASLHSIIQYLGVSTANMQDGSFRCDANISIRPRGTADLLTKVEIKNMNSFRAVYNALQYEEKRQLAAVKEGGDIVQETRGWVEESKCTVSQRRKEYAHDYRYFPEPDLPPLVIDQSWVEAIAERIPELPAQRRARFIAEYHLPSSDAAQLIASKAVADYFEEAVALSSAQSRDSAKSLSNWVLVELTRLLNLEGMAISDTKVSPAHLAQLVNMIDSGKLSSTLAKAVLEEASRSGQMPEEIAQAQGYIQINDQSVVATAVEDAIGSNAQAVADYLKGRDGAVRFLVGQVMKRTRGNANPDLVTGILREKLEALKSTTSTE